MKKAALLVLLLAFSASMASAETVKSASEKTGNFWSKEAERAGWKQSTSSWGSFWQSVNPAKFFKDQQDAYNARRSGGADSMKTGAIAK